MYNSDPCVRQAVRSHEGNIMQKWITFDLYCLDLYYAKNKNFYLNFTETSTS